VAARFVVLLCDVGECLKAEPAVEFNSIPYTPTRLSITQVFSVAKYFASCSGKIYSIYPA
jgi:hypothetical protein